MYQNESELTIIHTHVVWKMFQFKGGPKYVDLMREEWTGSLPVSLSPGCYELIRDNKQTDCVWDVQAVTNTAKTVSLNTTPHYGNQIKQNIRSRGSIEDRWNPAMRLPDLNHLFFILISSYIVNRPLVTEMDKRLGGILIDFYTLMGKCAQHTLKYSIDSLICSHISEVFRWIFPRPW